MFKTPALHARGRWQVSAPFVVETNTVYECIAIRSFPDITKEGVDVYKRHYQPKGIALDRYQTDVRLGANIITLQAARLPLLYIPDSFIEVAPPIGDVAYNHVVLSISLGALPDSLDLSFLKNQLAGACSDVIGVSGTVNEHLAPSDDVVTWSDHLTLDAARNAAIANRTTDRARYLEAQSIVDAQRQRIEVLEQILIDKGYIS